MRRGPSDVIVSEVMMKNATRFTLALPLALALSVGSLAAVGCGGSVEQPQTQATAASKAPLAAQSRGVVKLFGEALGDVELRADQRTELEKLAVAADARHAAMAAGKKDLMLALADQVEKGSIDRAALQPKIDRIVGDLEKARPEDNAALVRMHALLDANQRNAFVDALESRFKGKRHGKHGGEKGEAGEHAEQAGPMAGMHAMKQLADDLKLTDDQRSQIKDALKSGREGHSFREMRDRMGEGKKALESFRTDTFDPNAAGPPPAELRARAAAGTGRVVGIAEKVLPILTPEQRKLAAEKLRTLAGTDIPFAH
jgi:Spy/CpxP family protein refolding chaperone